MVQRAESTVKCSGSPELLDTSPPVPSMTPFSQPRHMGPNSF